jgi:hypothetical protein
MIMESVIQKLILIMDVVDIHQIVLRAIVIRMELLEVYEKRTNNIYLYIQM